MINSHTHTKIRSPQQEATSNHLAIIAHQGIQGNFPPNSLASISAAFGIAEATEFDLYVANSTSSPNHKDVIVIHPEGYYLFINKAGMKNESHIPASLEQLRDVYVGERRLVPTLSEVLSEYSKRCQETGQRTELHIELKGPETAELVIPILQAYIARGELTYDDFLICAFCYKGDNPSRLEIAKSLDPKIRTCLFIRGGDFSMDAFKSIDEALSFARTHHIELINLTRRLADKGIISKIKSAGFKVGCHHSRTSDELAAALALGVDSVQADFYCGPTLKDYPNLRRNDELFHALHSLEFFKLRDWIWELGWELERKRTSVEPEIIKSATLPDVLNGAHAQLTQTSIHPALLRLNICDTISYTGVDLSNYKLTNNYFGNFELIDLPNQQITISTLLQESYLLNLFHKIITKLEESALCSITAETTKFTNNITFNDIVKLSEGDSSSILANSSYHLSAQELRTIEDLSQNILVRTGRLIGMLGFTALSPRHGKLDDYNLVIDSDLCRVSYWVNVGANEQVNAQLLRSGKSGACNFIT